MCTITIALQLVLLSLSIVSGPLLQPCDDSINIVVDVFFVVALKLVNNFLFVRFPDAAIDNNYVAGGNLFK